MGKFDALMDPAHFNDEESWTDEEREYVENAMGEFLDEFSKGYFSELDPDMKKYNAAMEYAHDAGYDTNDAEQIFALGEEVRQKLDALESQIDHDIEIEDESSKDLHQKMYADLMEISFGIMGIMLDKVDY